MYTVDIRKQLKLGTIIINNLTGLNHIASFTEEWKLRTVHQNMLHLDTAKLATVLDITIDVTCLNRN